ncbi:unnamed protein product [Amaranthus hypochondriacus]
MTSSSIETTTTAAATATATATTWSTQLNIMMPRRPWRLLFNRNSLSCSNNVYDVVSRIKTNFCYFYINYLIIIFSCTFCLYFFNVWSCFLVCLILNRDEPPVYNGRPINMPVVWTVIWILFWVQFLLTGALGNLFLGLVTGAAVVVIYLVFRRSDDLYLNEEEAVEAGLVASSTGIIHHHGLSNLA